ncbi:Succinate dehydrogenase cytochrome B subunit [Penicillium rolfsii]|nr:Succinate dehydrogenase cytochrome B subunit [Penicillium rolfsii]
MTIYKWQYVSSVSALQHITGIVLSGGLYGFATLYLLAPATGIHFDSSTIATSFGSLPLAVKIAVKFGLSIPFTYHGFNGIKHLVWDTGRLLGKEYSGRASWIVLGCSLSTSFALALIQF